MNRRLFIVGAGGLVSGGLAGTAAVKAWNTFRPQAAATVAPVEPAPMPELKADVVIIGGGTGGVAAALGALREGVSVILTEETDWIGGQFTTQCVPPDEHQYVERSGATKEYRRLRNLTRDFYRQRTKPALTASAKNNVTLNPGNGWVSRLCAEPKVWLQSMEIMLQPFVASGQLKILRDWTPVAVDVEGDRFRAVTGRMLDGRTQTILGQIFLDATEQGDLLPLGRVEYVTGSEAGEKTGEPSASPKARPRNIQSFTWVMALAHDPGQNHTISKPNEYDFWRNYEPKLNPPTKAKRQLSWEYPGPDANGKPRLGFDPTKDKSDWGPNLWTYRRCVDAKLFLPGSGVQDISLINWGQNDYHRGPLHGLDEQGVELSAEEAAKNSASAKQLTLSLLYWLQTEAPRADGGTGWPGLRLCPDVTGTVDGVAKRPYIRESRRILSEFTILEQYVSKPAREKAHRGDGPARAMLFPDSVGVGLYLYIDIHSTSGGDNSGGGGVLPFQIPLGSLIPQRVENLLAACKNLGVTHITNGCYRLHTVEWSIGEAAGAAAGYAIQQKLNVKQIRNEANRFADFHKRLVAGGVETEWPATAKN